MAVNDDRENQGARSAILSQSRARSPALPMARRAAQNSSRSREGRRRDANGRLGRRPPGRSAGGRGARMPSRSQGIVRAPRMEERIAGIARSVTGRGCDLAASGGLLVHSAGHDEERTGPRRDRGEGRRTRQASRVGLVSLRHAIPGREEGSGSWRPPSSVHYDFDFLKMMNDYPWPAARRGARGRDARRSGRDRSVSRWRSLPSASSWPRCAPPARSWATMPS